MALFSPFLFFIFRCSNISTNFCPFLSSCSVFKLWIRATKEDQHQNTHVTPRNTLKLHGLDRAYNQIHFKGTKKIAIKKWIMVFSSDQQLSQDFPSPQAGGGFAEQEPSFAKKGIGNCCLPGSRSIRFFIRIVNCQCYTSWLGVDSDNKLPMCNEP